MEADVGEDLEGTDPLQLMAGVAADAAPLGKAKRKAALQGGRQASRFQLCPPRAGEHSSQSRFGRAASPRLCVARRARAT